LLLSLTTGLLATGIAMGAFGGAATGPIGQECVWDALHGLDTPLYASLEPTFGQSHTVKSGENDWTIAKKYGVTVEALHSANPSVEWRKLQIGQKLSIPTKGGSTSSRPSGGSYTVKSGDNDNTIAKQFGVTVEQLHAANPGTDWRRLQIGHKLHLPGGAEDTSHIKTISTSKVKVNTNNVNVRSKPTTSSDSKTTVDKGTVAAVLDRQGAWYELRFPHGTTGWIRGDLLTAVAERTTSTTTEKTEEVAEAAPSNPDIAQSIIDSAKSLLGVRYKWGGTSRGGVDCSGLTTFAFSHNGISLPRTSIEQSKIGQRVSKEDLEPGDLLFFVTGRSSSRINHVGLYIGNGKFIHASSYRHQVVITELDDYSKAYAGARRVAALQQKDVEKKTEPAADETPQVSIDELFPSRVVYGADKTGK
jgi:cell wall-associated NlpC family hydrolase